MPIQKPKFIPSPPTFVEQEDQMNKNIREGRAWNDNGPIHETSFIKQKQSKQMPIQKPIQHPIVTPVRPPVQFPIKKPIQKPIQKYTGFKPNPPQITFYRDGVMQNTLPDWMPDHKRITGFIGTKANPQPNHGTYTPEEGDRFYIKSRLGNGIGFSYVSYTYTNGNWVTKSGQVW